MRKSRSLCRVRRRRERTLNVCLPHLIKDKQDIENLFVGNFHVKLPRQSSKSCRVVFRNVEDKIKNYKLAKNKIINGKQIILQTLRPPIRPVKKVKKKKIVIPEIKPEMKVTQSLFVSNISLSTKTDEVKGILPGCVSVALLKPYNNNFRSAIAKMENIQIAAEYLKKQRKWPILKGHKICLKADTRKKHKKRLSTKKISDTIKIYDDVPVKKCESSKTENLDFISINTDSN